MSGGIPPYYCDAASTALRRVSTQHRLDLQKVTQPVLAVFAAVAGDLEAAKWSVHVPLRTVDRHLPRSNTPPHARGTDQIGGPDIGREPVRGIVGDPDGFLFTLVRQNAQYGS